MYRRDPLMPVAALLPLCDTAAGGRLPLEHSPGPLRPFSATLGVVPIQCGEATADRGRAPLRSGHATNVGQQRCS
jgi:hypothetical protein